MYFEVRKDSSNGKSEYGVLVARCSDYESAKRIRDDLNKRLLPERHAWIVFPERR